MTGNFFSRAGMFTADRDGFLTNADGMRVQGFAAGEDGSIGSTLEDIRVAEPITAPQATENVDLRLNLSAAQDVPVQTFDITDAAGTSSFSNSVVVYDSLGAAHTVTMHYTRTGPQSWEWNAVVDGSEVAGGTPDTPTLLARGTLGFDTEGRLDTEVRDTTVGPINFVNATPDQQIDFDFGDSITTEGGTGEGTTAFAEEFAVNSLDQDGFRTGEFVDLEVDRDGVVVASYTNGERVTVARVALADFRAPEGLARVGNTLFRETLESGDGFIGFANTGGRGEIAGGALEQSNVDLSTEFVRLINDQRAFQAATRTITTADELLAETINLKR
jgi:flagellar hook protein FlgE